MHTDPPKFAASSGQVLTEEQKQKIMDTGIWTGQQPRSDIRRANDVGRKSTSKRNMETQGNPFRGKMRKKFENRAANRAAREESKMIQDQAESEAIKQAQSESTRHLFPGSKSIEDIMSGETVSISSERASGSSESAQSPILPPPSAKKSRKSGKGAS